MGEVNPTEGSRIVHNPLEIGRTPLCPRCGYVLSGLASDRCPECGTPFDLVRIHLSADDVVRERVKKLQTASFLAAGGAVAAAFPVLSNLFVLVGAPAAVALAYAGVVVVSVARWRWSRLGRVALGSALSAYRRDFSRTFVVSLTVCFCALVAGSLLLWVTWKTVSR